MKDYTILKDKLTKENQITTKDIIALGFSQYDIKLFVENDILTKVSRGLYYYRPSLVEELPVAEPETTPTIEEPQSNIPQVNISQKSNNATSLMIKKETDGAITEFEEILTIEPTNQYARFALFACYMFKKDFETAYTKLVDVYEKRSNNELLINIYNYMLLLKELVPVNEGMLNDIANIIATDSSNIKRPKIGTYLYKLVKSIREGDWEKALKYSSINVSIDKNQKKYRLTNQCYKYLVIAVIQSKNLVFDKKPVEEPAPPVEYEEEQTIIVPETKVEQTIKQNLLLEAINNNDYQTALTILGSEQIDNPLEVIKTLLTKLHRIQTLVTITSPVKVIATEEVRVVDENQIILPEFIDQPKKVKEVATPVVEEEKKEVVPSKNEVPKIDLIDLAYKAYKEFLNIQSFSEARRNLQRYEYLSNQNGTHRNIKYHYNRISVLEQEYKANPDRYFKKQQLQEAIIQAKFQKRYDEVLSLIGEYKKLGGLIHPTISVTEAETYILLNDFHKAELILNNIKNSEEPAYFKARARILYEQRKYEECVKMCIEYNERRPMQSAANYIMLSNCYKRLQKPGKAIKALRKAEEINKSKNYTKDLSGEIASLELQAESQKEQRLALVPPKNKK